MKICLYCGSENVICTGYEDGHGDYGDQVAETFQCEDCGEIMTSKQFALFDDLNQKDGDQ